MKKKSALFFTLFFALSSILDAAVAYDSSNKGFQTGGTSITSFNVNVVGTTNVACAIGIASDTTTITGITITFDGGSPATVLANTRATITSGIRTELYYFE